MFRLIIYAARTDLLGVLVKPEHLMRQLRNVVHDDFTGAAYQTHRSHAETGASPDIVEFAHGTFSLVGPQVQRGSVQRQAFASLQSDGLPRQHGNISLRAGNAHVADRKSVV